VIPRWHAKCFSMNCSCDCYLGGNSIDLSDALQIGDFSSKVILFMLATVYILTIINVYFYMKITFIIKDMRSDAADLDVFYKKVEVLFDKIEQLKDVSVDKYDYLEEKVSDMENRIKALQEELDKLKRKD
jgi:hypothetical protein